MTNFFHLITPGRRSRVRRLALVAGVVLASSTMGTTIGVENASAWQTVYDGRIGTVTIPIITGSSPTSFYVPGITVPRNGSVGQSQAQPISITYSLQWHNGTKWVTATEFTKASTIQQWKASVTAEPTSLQPWNFPGYKGAWRVALLVEWKSGWVSGGTPSVVGRLLAIPNGSEQRCGTAGCAAGAGYLWLT
jgi:hypothetical protein